MATSKQTAANRLNALKSTGPRTPEGKAVSGLNALRHGLRSRTVPPESSQELRDTREQFAADLQPQTAEQNLLVDRMARSSWQLAISERAEYKLLCDPVNAGIEAQLLIFDVFSRRQCAQQRAFCEANEQYMRSARDPRP